MCVCVCVRFPSFLHFYITPLLQRNAFSHPGRALVKVMAMTIGELDYDTVFHQEDLHPMATSLAPTHYKVSSRISCATPKEGPASTVCIMIHSFL